jgi:predicted Zn-dependent protease
MIISLKGKRSVIKSELMMLEMLAQTNWVRPLYVAITVGSENYMNLGDNFVQEGLAYRITPFNTKLSGRMLDSNRMYDNLMNKYRFGGVENPKAYFDENIRKMIYTHRRMFGQLAQQLIIEGQKAKAMKALDYCAKVIPASTVPHDIQSGSLDLAKAYVQLGAKNKAMPILNDLTKRTKEYINWYLSLTPNRLKMSAENCLYNIYMLSQLGQTMQQCDAARGKALINEAETFARLAQSKGVSLSMLEGGGE